MNPPELPCFALSVEAVLLKLSCVEPHFAWGDEIEIDPLDDEVCDEEYVAVSTVDRLPNV